MVTDNAETRPSPGRVSPLAAAAAALVRDAQRGILSTLIPDGGFPYGSLVELLPTPEGDVVMFLSRLAEHQRYLEMDPRASIAIAPHVFEEHAMAKPRVTLVGYVERAADRAALAPIYVRRHPDATAYIGFADFIFYRLRPERVRYIAGFGQMGWIHGDAYREAFQVQGM
jgi:putative heme iron utilization protein